MDEFQKRLKECRKEKGLTQKELAALLEISSTCYAGYEQGYREPDLKTLKKISLYFEVSTDYLLGLEDIDGSRIHAKNYIHNVNNHGNMTIK